ncbi:unnamed protein product [Dovyalis caffra]|uniref:Uncharacterized protein n=1 Tax=Dovyalis caffra TaxID=77055 RepID=A0AAV1S8C7_9ROSI|nr:unnamed protein product [Dovyalis caffra]
MEQDREFILSVPLSARWPKDSWQWFKEHDGSYESQAKLCQKICESNGHTLAMGVGSESSLRESVVYNRKAKFVNFIRDHTCKVRSTHQELQ